MLFCVLLMHFPHFLAGQMPSSPLQVTDWGLARGPDEAPYQGSAQVHIEGSDRRFDEEDRERGKWILKISTQYISLIGYMSSRIPQY